MLRYVASGPFPAATDMGTAGAILGLLVHFALMAIMAAVFMWLVRQRPRWLDTPDRTGIAYGLATYVVMNWLVVPLRFDTPLPPKPLVDRHPIVRPHRPGRHPHRADRRALFAAADRMTAGYSGTPLAKKL